VNVLLVSPLTSKSLLGADFYFRMPTLGLLRVAGAAHTGDPAALISTRGGEPVLKASLRLHGRRTRVRATFPVAFMGGDAGAYRLELSGSLSASAAVSVGPVPARRAPAVPRPPAP